MASKVLLTLAVLGFSAVPVLADLNRTHATNPRWVRHARFHVVWQVLSYVGLGLVVLGLLWAPGQDEIARGHLVALVAVCPYAGFFGAAASMRLYGGRLFDENGYPPVKVRLLARHVRIDLNTAVFSAGVLVVAVAWVLMAAA